MNSAAADLCVEDIHVWRADRHVLQGVNVTLGPGEVMHIRGPNGSGKTTLLRVVCGLFRPEQGVVRWGGCAISLVRAEFQRALAYASHEPALKGDLTALENLRYSVGLKRRVAMTELSDFLRQAGVADCAQLPARALSAGQRRRVALSRVLALQAPLWLLDEPYTNLDADGSDLLSKLLDQHVQAGGLALVVAHHELPLSTAVRRLSLDA